MTFAERLADLRDQFHAAKDRHSAEAARHREKFARDRQPQTEHQAQQSEARAKYYGRQLDSSARGKLLYEHDVPLTGGPLDALHPGYRELWSEAVQSGRYEMPAGSPQGAGQ
jgi:hypothetical protein